MSIQLYLRCCYNLKYLHVSHCSKKNSIIPDVHVCCFIFYGDRPNQSTFGQNCPFQISLRTTDDGKQLVITGFNNEHNHERNENLYKFPPRQRQLSANEKRDVQAMLIKKTSTSRNDGQNWKSYYIEGSS